MAMAIFLSIHLTNPAMWAWLTFQYVGLLARSLASSHFLCWVTVPAHLLASSGSWVLPFRVWGYCTGSLIGLLKKQVEENGCSSSTIFPIEAFSENLVR
jgi:hypothetical protein